MRPRTGTEVERLREVYDGYRRVGHHKWAPDNPGNVAMVVERNEAIVRALSSVGLQTLAGRRILDIGCGAGALLDLFAQHGAAASDLFGIDLLPDRIDIARASFPGMTFFSGNAEDMQLPSESFDVVTLFTVLSSILSAEMTANLVKEVRRVVRRGGFVLVYDFRLPSPFNRHTRPVGRREIASLFQAVPVYVESLTFVPPLARRMGRLTGDWYRRMASVPAFRTLNLVLLRLG